MKRLSNILVLLVAFVAITSYQPVSTSASKAAVSKKNVLIIKKAGNQTDPMGTVSGTGTYSSSGIVGVTWLGDPIPDDAFWDLDDSFTSFGLVTSHGFGGATSGGLNRAASAFGGTGTHTLRILYYDANNILQAYSLDYSFTIN